MDDVAPSMTRRGLLAGVGVGATTSLAGCWERLWSQAESSGPDQVSLTIKTLPRDDDEMALTIASQLRENYRAAGIDASQEPITTAELYRDVLLDGDYDVFVAKHPGLDEPDALHGLLHSQFRSEQGWQNPFQFADVTANTLLEDQRTADGDDREEVLVDLIDHLLQTTPYTVVAYPYALSGARDDLEVPAPPRRPHEYLEIMSQPGNGPRDGPLEVGVFGEELTAQLNPLTVDRNRIDGLLDLLYDPLARRIDGEYVPWLAEEIEWNDDGRLQARVRLREGAEWHDGESLTAEDVAFTLDFIGDTSLDSVDGGVPAPRFRSQQTLVSRTEVNSSRTITLFFTETSQAAARRALTIPVLPEHIWADRSAIVAERQTQALTIDNEEPIGSGLFVFGDVTADREVELDPFDAHPLRNATDAPSVLDGFSRFDGIRFQVAPNQGAMVDALIEDEIDVTGSQLSPDHAKSVREASGVSTVMSESDAFYVIGYNSQHPELGNPFFRRVCSRLIDREHAVDEFFNGFAQTATTPNELVGIHDDNWEYDEFDTDPDPTLLDFPGSDGTVDRSRARSLFRGRDTNYRYEGDALLESNS